MHTQILQPNPLANKGKAPHSADSRQDWTSTVVTQTWKQTNSFTCMSVLSSVQTIKDHNLSCIIHIDWCMRPDMYQCIMNIIKKSIFSLNAWVLH